MKIGIWAAVLLAGASTMAAVPAATEWEVAPMNEGTVRVEQASEEILAIRYDLTPDVKFMNGNRPRRVRNVDILLRKPIALEKDTERILFEASGLLRDGHGIPLIVELRPIVRDADGELFYLLPKERPALKRVRGQGWDSYTTAAIHSGEAGAASLGVYFVSGKVVNSWPDGKLELVGFQLHIGQEDRTGTEIKRRTGVVYLSDISSAGLRLPFTMPTAYAGVFLKKKGVYTLAGQVRNEFQGNPIREFRRSLDFDPEDPVKSKSKIEIPLGPDDHYWIDYQILDASGATLGSDAAKVQLIGAPETAKPTEVDMKSAPPVGVLRVNPGHAGRGVYAQGEPYAITVRAFPGERKNLELQYTLHPYYGNDVLASGKQLLTGGDMRLEFPRNASYNVFRLALNVLDGKKVIDSSVYVFGEKTDFTRTLDRAGKITNRRELKEQPYNRLSYVLLDVKRHSKPMQFYIDDFKKYLDDCAAFTSHVTVCPELNDFEVLPGVFDFSLLDAMMELAADYGCKATVRFAHADNHGGPYRWGKFSRQIAADGTVAGDGIGYGAYEVTDPALVKLWLDAYRALHKRYAKHTAFEGYYVMLPAGEWTVVDQPWDGVVAGYSAVGLPAFRNYLEKTLGLSIAELNKRWGSNFQSFNDVVPPQPTFELGSTPDLRMAWLDFCRYKAILGTHIWMGTAINDIRSYDDDRVTIAYGEPSKYGYLNGKLDYGHNGGNHSFDRRGAYVDIWKKDRVGWITEPIHPHGWAAHNDPGKGGWTLDVSIWTMLAQAGGGGANLHLYYFTIPQGFLWRYGGFYALDRFERFKPLLREIHGADMIVQGSDIAIHQDPETLYAKHRTTFGHRSRDLCRWFELLESDGVPSAFLKDFPDRKFKLIVPNLLDEVIALNTLKAYEKAVREDGAKMLIGANTGKYVPELGTEPFQLLKALGITAPTGKYIQLGEIKAVAEQGNPLFDAGTKIDFQSLSTLRTQSTSPEIRSIFWRYPYRWIPETDYFGHYPGVKPNGDVLARFADGGAALSRHKVGKGEVLVFWGTPDMSSNKLAGMMARAAAWAGAENPFKGTPVPNFFEMTNRKINRHYGIMCLEEKYGTFQIKFPNCPDGDFFCDEVVGDHKIGRRSGKELRETGVPVSWRKGDSPLKVVRIIPTRGISKEWVDLYNK